MAKTLEEYEKEAAKVTDPQRLADIEASNKNFDTQKQLTTDTYNKYINDAKASYNDLYDKNAVQRLINEREVAEGMANLGLTNSGLNRTQQTAVQLSYANQKGKLDTERQKAIDDYSFELASKITELDMQKANAAAEIESNYKSANLSTAQDMYSTALEQEAETKKAYYSYLEKVATLQATAEKENSYIIKANGGLLSYDYEGRLKDRGVYVYYETDSDGNAVTRYVDSNSGKSTTFQRGVNPYTGGDINEDLLTNGVYDEKRAFSNGYQPRYIGEIELEAVEGETGQIPGTGRNQKIFKKVTSSGTSKSNAANKRNSDTTYWIWYGGGNKYVQVWKNKDTMKWEFVEDVY